MPDPRAGESRDSYIERFMGSPEAQADFPDEKQRLAVGYKKWRSDNGKPVLNEDDDDLKEYLLEIMAVPAGQIPREKAKQAERERTNARGQVGRKMPMRFILPGLVRYNDVGDVMVGKEALDRILKTFEGRPIFEGHQDVTKTDFTDGKAVGMVGGNLRFNAEDGWYWGDVYVWDQDTEAKIRSGWTLSCAYDVTEWAGGGIHNNIPYDREVVNGEYTHLAIVPNPRYEGVRILYNQGGRMKLKFWPFAKDVKPEDQKASEVELTNAVVKVGEKDVQLSEMIAHYEAEEKAKADAALLNSLSDETMVEVAGKRVSVKDLKNAYAAKLANEAKDKDEKDEKDDKDMKNADEEEKKKKEKEDEERKNAEEKEKKEKDEKDEEERKNAKHFEDLKNARNKGEGTFVPPNLRTSADKVAEGQKRYGTK